MRFFKISIFCLIDLLLASCSTSGIMRDAETELLRPDNVVSLSFDTTFLYTFPEVQYPARLQIVDDTLLVVQEPTNATNSYHFKVYTLNSFDYLGTMISNGRGPGEMINPYIARSCSDCKNLNILQYQTAEVYSINVSKSLNIGKTVVSHKSSFPVGVIDCLPLSDSNCLFLQSENGHLLLRAINDNGAVINTFHYSEGLDNESFITHLSCLLVGNSRKGDVAEIMMFFPMINIFDIERGTVKSIAVDKSYQNWQTVTSSMIGMETKQYYVSATASEDYIFAVYKDLSLSELMRGGHGTSIHVFDWDGNFLYDLKVKENIEDITYDGISKHMYCIEKSECRIIRYKLGTFI